MTSALEKLRAFAVTVDGSWLDEATWRHRHRLIMDVAWALTGVVVVFTLLHSGGQRGLQWAYTLATVGFAILGEIRIRSRRWLEFLAVGAMATAEVYGLHFIGNLALAPLTIIVLTFYEDWVPVALGCLLTAGLAVLSWVDPAWYAHTRALEREPIFLGVSFRAFSVFAAAVLAVAIWRSGTQRARDQLTGMLTRPGAERRLAREIARGHRPAVWICAVDNFASIDAHLGRDLAERLLRDVAAELRRVSRGLPESSFTAHLEADTFLIATHGLQDEDAVASFAYRLEDETGLASTSTDPGRTPVRLSVGSASVADGESAAELIAVAERNMHEAKGRGSVRVVVDRRQGHELQAGEPPLSSDLHRACERNEFELYLQPVVRLADGMPVGAEALARWHHPQRGLLLPREFLPYAERDSALMAKVSRTLGTAYLKIVAGLVRRNGRGWLEHGYAFNMAAIRLRDPQLSSFLAADVIAAGIDQIGGLLLLEVTEGALMDIEHDVPAVLHELRDSGYRLALDDFGTGHSSLSNLRDFPLDSVKLDRTFIETIDRSPTDRAIVQAVVDIASASGLKVVAEGVETEEQRAVLLEIHPDLLAQGWLFAKAMPVSEFEGWVQAHVTS